VYGVAHAAIDKYAADLKVHHGVLYNAVPSMIQSEEIGQKLCNRDDLLDSTLIIGTIGRIKPGKGYEIFIEAAHILLKRNIALRFVIAGEPSSPWQEKYYSSLKQQVQELGIEENVFFAGYMSQEEFMSCVDIVCNPSSHTEVCSMVILEAFAARRPVVATRLGGTPELIRDGANGLLTLPGDAEGLAKNLDMLIQDAELREKLGSSAYRIYQERYNLEIWKENLIDLYAKYCRRN
jgi:glycosyltransferase involved in cell wall biosynthesis